MSTNQHKKHDYNQECIKKNVSCIKIFWTFFRVGLLTFGGGLAMSAVIRYELVFKNKWIKEEDFLSVFSTATIIPGSIAVNIAYLQGNRFQGKKGAATAILGTILPSFLIILAIAYFGLPYFNHPRVTAFFKGSALAVAGQLLFSGYIFSKKLLVKWKNVFICLVSLFVVAIIGLHPIWALLVSAILGYFLFNQKNHTYINSSN